MCGVVRAPSSKTGCHGTFFCFRLKKPPWLPGVIHLIYCCFNRFPLSHFHWLSICFPKLLEQKRPFPVCRPNGGTCSTELRLANLLLECYQPWCNHCYSNLEFLELQ